MAPPPHRIGRLRVEASIGTFDEAHALRTRIEALARDAVPAALERAFDALGLGDRHLRIDRLDLELGEVRAETLEADIVAALDRAIGPALKAAKARHLTSARAEAAALRAYLATGITPAFGGSDFDPAARLRKLAAADPAAFAHLTRTAGRRGTARRRLATLGHGAMPRGEARPRGLDPAHSLYIQNAGLVLLNPYLPLLFERLGLLSHAGGQPRATGLDAASRAVHLLEYCATGRLDTPEPALVLNKLLAGLPLDTPVATAITPSPADLATCDSMLAALIANWPQLRNSSVAAVRETFLQREGRLDRTDTGWRLRVQRKTLDVLLDQIPWSFAVVFHRWMPDPIHVTW